jgi:hypothetical protein
MAPWLLTFLRPRASYFFRGRVKRYLFWATLILFGGPLVLKDEYARPLIETQEKVMGFFKSTTTHITRSMK